MKLTLLLSALFFQLIGMAQWTPMNVMPAAGQMEDVFFLNKDTGYVSGNEWGSSTSTLYRTTNGGATWQGIYNSSVWMSGVYFLNYMEGFVSTTDGGFSTTDGGVTWNSMNTSAINSGYFCFPTPNTGILYDTQADINHRTEDGGATWLNIPLGSFNNDFIHRMSCTPTASYALIDLYGYLYKTVTGASWTLIGQVVDGQDIHFLDANNGYAITYSSVLSTSDGGVTWNTINASQGGSSIFAINPSLIYILDDNGSVMKSTNGGSNFTMTTGTSNDILFFTIVDNVGYAVGSNAYKMGNISNVPNIEIGNYLQLWPNPGTGAYTIRTDEQHTISLKNVLGEEILTTTIPPGNTTLDLSLQPTGMYFVTLMDVPTVSAMKLVKQ